MATKRAKQRLPQPADGARVSSGPTMPQVACAVLALVAVTAFVYAPAWHYEFVSWDDGRAIVSNPNIVQGLTWQSAWWALTTTYEGYWMPLTWLSRLLDVTLFGLNTRAAITSPMSSSTS
jgi:hypothetical protein